MNFTDEDVKLIEKFIQIRNSGFYCDGGQLTNVYNRVLERNVMPTNCGSCMRARISELENALNSFKKTMEIKDSDSSNDTEGSYTKQDVNKAVTDAGNDDIKARMAKVRAARKRKG